MLAAVTINHHMVIAGLIIIAPVFTIILRERVLSYDVFAITNKADLIRP